MIVLLIGVNNPDPAEAAERLGALLAWLAAAQPQARLVVLAPLPTVLPKGRQLAKRIRSVLEEQHPEVGGAAGRQLGCSDEATGAVDAQWEAAPLAAAGGGRQPWAGGARMAGPRFKREMPQQVVAAAGMQNGSPAPPPAPPSPQVVHSECGQELDPLDPALMKDGLHPVAAGFEILLSCLADQAAALLATGEAQEQAARDGAGGGMAAAAPVPAPATNFTDF